MDGVRGLSGITGAPLVGERSAGNQQQQADAFREAMQEQATGDGTAAEREPAKTPMRGALQPRGVISRNEQGEAMHVDVIA